MTIQRGKDGLGFILSSQNPCVVSSINYNGPADQAGLKTGDEILEVNSVDVSILKHDDVVKHILKYNTCVVELKVRTFCVSNSSENGSPRKGFFENVNRVMRGLRTSMIFNSPIAPKKLDKINSSHWEIVDLKSDTNGSFNRVDKDNSTTVSNTKNFTNLSNRRLIKETSVEDDVKKEQRSFSYPIGDGYSLPRTPGTKNNRPYTMFIGNDFKNKTTPNILANIFGVQNIEKTDYQKNVKHISSPEVKSIDSSKTSVICNPGQVYNVVVYYQCTIEIPNDTNLPVAGLSALNSCVHNIQRGHKNTSSMVLLTITTFGLTLTNPVGKEIVTYPLKTLAFSGISSVDKSYFGFVTRKILTDQSPAMSSSFKNSPNLSKARPVVLCSCHVFMISSNLVDHEAHVGTATLFRLICKPGTNGCVNFPASASVILQELNSFYDER